MDELDHLSKRLDSTGSGSLRGDLVAKMSVIHTTISKVEAYIKQYANWLEECQLREHEAQGVDQE